MLLIDLRCERGFDFCDFVVAEFFFDPIDDQIFGEIGEGHHVVTALEAEAAIGACAISAVGCVDRVVSGEDVTVAGLALEVGDMPGVGGAHGGGTDLDKLQMGSDLGLLPQVRHPLLIHIAPDVLVAGEAPHEGA